MVEIKVETDKLSKTLNECLEITRKLKKISGLSLYLAFKEFGEEKENAKRKNEKDKNT